MICQKDSLSQLFGTCFFQRLPASDLRASALKLAYTDTAACNCVNFRGENGKKNSKYLFKSAEKLKKQGKNGVHAPPPAARWSAVC